MNKVWQEHENQYIRDNAAKMTDKDLAISLSKIAGRTISMGALRKQRQKLKISKGNGRGVCKVITKTDPNNIGRRVLPIHMKRPDFS